MAAGAVLGLWVTMPLVKRWTREVVFVRSLALWGLVFASLGLFPNPIWAGAAALLIGLLNTMFTAPFGATMQSAVLLRTLLAGLLEPRLGVLTVLWLSGFTVFLVVFTVILRGGVPRPTVEA